MSPVLRFLLPLLILGAGEASAGDSLRGLPEPVKAFALQFEQECKSNGLGHLIINDNFEGQRSKPEDINSDGLPDYFVYRCMFGCSEKPSALEGRGTACPWGSLLLSDEHGHQAVFLPGIVTEIFPGMPVRVSITRPRTLRIIGNFCEDGFGDHDPQHVYELKDGRFQSRGMCPDGGCSILLSELESTSRP